MAKISIVFSFRNEEEVLPILIEKITNVLNQEPEDYELIFVNDDSLDNSVEVIRKHSHLAKNIKILNMSRRFGVEECFLAGIEHASGDAIILMYTDLQDPPEVIREMLREWRNGAEIVHTVRRKRVGEKMIKVVAAFLAYRLISKIADISIPKDSGEFKLISKRVATHLLNLSENDPYLRGLIPWIGFKQASVTYDLQPRAVGKSKVPLYGKKAWSVFLSGITSFSFLPISFFLVLGIFGTGICSISFIIELILLAFNKISSNIFIFTAIFLFLSIMMVQIGFLGNYIAKIYKDVRGRPRYIVKDIINVK
ncbi:MAG: glycosyltransferase family 2 protein [Desulfobacterales bacterium]|nr:glycosyltransferase family 2 protein [Desulfobacterales bacterium]